MRRSPVTILYWHLFPSRPWRRNVLRDRRRWRHVCMRTEWYRFEGGLGMYVGTLSRWLHGGGGGSAVCDFFRWQHANEGDTRGALIYTRRRREMALLSNWDLWNRRISIGGPIYSCTPPTQYTRKTASSPSYSFSNSGIPNRWWLAATIAALFLLLELR